MDPDLKQRWIWKGWSGWPTKTLICVFRHSVKAVNLVITTNQRVILSKFIYPKMVDLIAMFCHICFHWVRNKGSTSGKSSPRLKQKLSTAYWLWFRTLVQGFFVSVTWDVLIIKDDNSNYVELHAVVSEDQLTVAGALLGWNKGSTLQNSCHWPGIYSQELDDCRA